VGQHYGGLFHFEELIRKEKLMEILFIGVNWLAVGVSTILCFMLGGLWYSPRLFGTKWAEGVGVPTGPGTKQPIAALLMQFVATLLLAWIMSVAHNIGAYPTAVLIVITAACLLMAGNMFAGHNNDSTIIEGAFVIVMALIMSVCNTIL
tara:strand:+ start:5841 stop:6287 length:447 start_codon:yes stop_codon:yes gene_type:complete